MTLELQNIHHTYHQGQSILEILRGVNLTVSGGEMAALVAPSGSGKSTLLHIAGLLDTPAVGEVIIDGINTSRLNDKQRSALRGQKIGFVYQFHHLLPEFSALENIVLPQLFNGISETVATLRAKQLLDYVGLMPRAAHRPMELSGGEQQRVAILRALANAPKLLLADEPTGNLDAATADTVFQMLQKLVKFAGMSSLIVTHNIDLARRMDRIYTIQNGLIVPY